MIIDDEPSIRESLQWYLEELGHVVYTAKSAEACVDYGDNCCSLRVPAIDALIVDHQLPRQLGLDLLEQLNRSGCPVSQKAILTSGDTTCFCHDRVKQLGVTVVQKPMSLQFVKDWLRGVALQNH
jgi:DNA-binding response OmpR family regulator